MRSSDFGVILLLSEDEMRKSPKSQWQMFYFAMYLFVFLFSPILSCMFPKTEQSCQFRSKNLKIPMAHVDVLPNDSEPCCIVLMFPKNKFQTLLLEKRDKLTKSIVHKHIITLKCIVLHAVAAWAFGNAMCATCV